MSSFGIPPLNPFKAFLIGYAQRCLQIFEDAKGTPSEIDYMYVSNGEIELNKKEGKLPLMFDNETRPIICINGRNSPITQITQVSYLAREEHLKEVLGLLGVTTHKFYAIHSGDTLEIYCTKPRPSRANTRGIISLDKSFNPIRPIELTDETVRSLIGKVNQIVFSPDNETTLTETSLALKLLIKPLGIPSMQINFNQQI